MSLMRDLMTDASNVVNTTLGVLCYYEQVTGDILDAHIVIDKNKPVKDDFNLIIGYRVEASILKSEVPTIKNNEYFTDSETGQRYRVSQVTKESLAKWYVDIIEV